MVMLFDIWFENPLLVGTTLVVLIGVNFHLLKRSYHLWKLNYAHHYKQSFYIAKPSQREILEDNKPVNLRLWLSWVIQIVLVILFSLFYNSPVSDLPIKLVSEVIIGFLIGQYVSSITRLLGNIYQFRFVINNPQSIIGEVTLSDEYLFASLRYDAGFESFFWFVIFLCVAQVFFLGICLNSIIQISSIYKWESESLVKKYSEIV